jgi:hypothetical protein
MREDDRLPRFNRYLISLRPGTVECRLCPAWVKPEGMADHFKAKHPGELPSRAPFQWIWREGAAVYRSEGETFEQAKANAKADPSNPYGKESLI